MAATARVIEKNLFNKSRVRKAKLFKALLNECFTCSYPNGNSGYEQSVIYALCEIFPSTVARRVNGDPHSMGHVSFDASHLTTADESKIKNWLLPADGMPVDENNPMRGWAYEIYPVGDPLEGHRHSGKFVDRDSVWKKMQRGCRPYYHRLIGMAQA
jgi:hypothetical protein